MDATILDEIETTSKGIPYLLELAKAVTKYYSVELKSDDGEETSISGNQLAHSHDIAEAYLEFGHGNRILQNIWETEVEPSYIKARPYMASPHRTAYDWMSSDGVRHLEKLLERLCPDISVRHSYLPTLEQTRYHDKLATIARDAD